MRGLGGDEEGRRGWEMRPVRTQGQDGRGGAGWPPEATFRWGGRGLPGGRLTSADREIPTSCPVVPPLGKLSLKSGALIRRLASVAPCWAS